MTKVLVHWNESRSGQSDEFALHNESDGTEIESWAHDPRPDSPDGSDKSNLDSLYNNISGEWWYFIRESSDTPFPW